jgi:dienelactone hydrolase
VPGSQLSGTDPASRIEWLGEETSAGCVERSFVTRRRSGIVPGVLWLSATLRRPPAVLLFHGGSGHKRSERHLRMGRWLASTAGLAVIAIDGPYHGDRVPAPMAPSAYQQLIVDEGVERVTARMTGDWLTAVSALAALGLVDDANVSVFGMSMGARFGLPVATALGPRLRCAVLGKFDALASVDKRLIARPGQHSETHPDDEASWQEFMDRYTAHLRKRRHGGTGPRIPEAQRWPRYPAAR